MFQIHWDRSGLVQCQVSEAERQLSLLTGVRLARGVTAGPAIFYKMVAEVNEGKRVQEVSEGKQQKWLLSASVKSHQETGDKPNLQDTWDFHASDYFCDTGVTCRPTTFTSLPCMKYCCKT